jgi:hypothetical protein
LTLIHSERDPITPMDLPAPLPLRRRRTVDSTPDQARCRRRLADQRHRRAVAPGDRITSIT